MARDVQETMDLPAQFVCWRHEVNDKGASIKVPYSPRTGKKINHLQAANWMTEQEARELCAQSQGAGVGFVLTDRDPFCVIDIDNCRIEGDQYHAWAHMAISPFYTQGAAFEISQSGYGVHLAGTLTDIKDVHLYKNKWADDAGNKFEFYFKDRFIAFGPYGWHQSWHAIIDAQIAALVPMRNLTELVDVGVRDPNWNGPEDDQILLDKMLSSTGGMFHAAGKKATIAELWYARDLHVHFPTNSDNPLDFDHSSADLALMSHLAFWTGKDAARMDRIFRMSALCRDKYLNRDDYRQGTILAAIKGTMSVYGQRKEKPATEAGQFDREGVAARVDTTIVMHDQLSTVFQGCTYIKRHHAVLMPDGYLLTPAQFKTVMGGKSWQVSHNGRPSKDAWEAFSNNQTWRPPMARDFAFRPDAPFGHMFEDDTVNKYIPPVIDVKEGDPAPFLDLLTRLLPQEHDRQILLHWMARVAQSPGFRTRWAPVMQGVEGNGKSLVMKFMEYAVGERYTHYPTPEDMQEKYNGYVSDSLLVCVEEIDMAGRRTMLDKLKPLITNDRVEIRMMGTDKYMATNRTNWMFATNHRGAIIKTKDDRRYAIFHTAQQSVDDLHRDGMTADYFTAMYQWLKGDGGAIVTHYLRHFPMTSELDPGAKCIRAPETTSTATAIDESMSPAEAAIADAIAADEVGFRGGYMSAYHITNKLRAVGVGSAPRTLASIAARFGYKSLGRSPTVLFEEGNNKPTIYGIKLSPPPVELYAQAQGYITARGV